MEENKGLGENNGASDKPADGFVAELEAPKEAASALPFDIDKLCNFGFDVLKEAIEYLAKQQAEMNNRFGALESKEKEYVPITIVEKTVEKVA